MILVNKLKNKSEQPKEEYLKRYFEDNICLNDNDIEQITTRYKAGFYSLALDYIWRKGRQIVKDFLTGLGEDAVNNIVFIPKESRPSPFTCFELQALQLLGIINKNQKYELQKVYLQVQHSIKDPNIINEKTLLSIIDVSTKAIFNKNFEDIKDKILEAKEYALNNLIENSKVYSKLFLNTGKRYYVSAIMHMLYAYASSDKKDVIAQNLRYLTKQVWSKLKYEERLQIGYFASCSDEDTKKIAKELLAYGAEMSYISESKNINDIIILSKEAISAFYSFQNKSLMTDALYDISQIDNLPIKYCNMYLSACLLCITDDDQNNESNTSYVKKIFEKTSYEKWQYYFNFCFCEDANLLFRLCYYKTARINMYHFLNEFDFSSISISNDKTKKLLLALCEQNHYDVTKITKAILY